MVLRFMGCISSFIAQKVRFLSEGDYLHPGPRIYEADLQLRQGQGCSGLEKLLQDRPLATLNILHRGFSCNES